MAIKANPLVTGDAAANSLQPANVALAELIESVRRLEPAIRGTSKAAGDATKEIATSALSFGSFAAGLTRFSLVTGIATHQFSVFTSAIESGIASAVGAFDPAAVKRWELTVRDLHAVFGDIFRPVLERANVIVRALADGIESLSPSAKTMVAALAVAGVSMVVMTAATAAFSAAVATATGGLSLAIGAVVGGISAVGAGVGTMALSMDEFKDTVRAVAAAGSVALDELGRAAAKLLPAFSAAVPEVAKLAVAAVRLGTAATLAANDLIVLISRLELFRGMVTGMATTVYQLLAAVPAGLDVFRHLTRLDKDGIGGSEGKSVANVRIGSTLDLRNELLKNAFSLGDAAKKPEAATASNTETMARTLERIEGLLSGSGRLSVSVLGWTPDRVGRAAVESGAANAINPYLASDRLRQMFD